MRWVRALFLVFLISCSLASANTHDFQMRVSHVDWERLEEDILAFNGRMIRLDITVEILNTFSKIKSISFYDTCMYQPTLSAELENSSLSFQSWVWGCGLMVTDVDLLSGVNSYNWTTGGEFSTYLDVVPNGNYTISFRKASNADINYINATIRVDDNGVDIELPEFEDFTIQRGHLIIPIVSVSIILLTLRLMSRKSK